MSVVEQKQQIMKFSKCAHSLGLLLDLFIEKKGIVLSPDF